MKAGVAGLARVEKHTDVHVSGYKVSRSRG